MHFTLFNYSISIFFISVFVYSTNAQQWQQLNANTPVHLHEAFFIDKDLGYVVGDSGTIIKTSDGGVNWEHQNSGLSNHIYNVFFQNANLGYAASNDTILKTMDGGANWNVLDTSNKRIVQIQFLGLDTGYVVCRGQIMKTTDGGNNWSKFYSPPGAEVFWALDTATFNVGADDRVTLNSTNGGQSWNLISGPYSGPSAFEAINFIDDSNGYMVGGTLAFGNTYPIYQKTNNGGLSWTLINNITPLQGQWLKSIFYTDNDHGYIVTMYGKIFHTNTQGSGWIEQTSPVTTQLNDIFFPDDSIGYIVGNNGVILKTNVDFSGLKEQNQQEFEVFPNPFSSRLTLALTFDTNEISSMTLKSALGKNIDLSPLLIIDSIYSNTFELNTESLSKGVYFLTIKTANQNVSKKLIKE